MPLHILRAGEPGGVEQLAAESVVGGLDYQIFGQRKTVAFMQGPSGLTGRCLEQ